jgi:hypothetical protein
MSDVEGEIQAWGHRTAQTSRLCDHSFEAKCGPVDDQSALAYDVAWKGRLMTFTMSEGARDCSDRKRSG